MISAEERAKAFAAAVDEHQKEEERKQLKKERGPYNPDFEQVTWMGLDRSFRVFRAVGMPPNQRLDGTDALHVFHSRIADDKGETERHVIWKPALKADGSLVMEGSKAQLDESWILYRLYNEITSFEWKKKTQEEWDKGVPGVKLYKYEDSDAFKRVMHNKRKNSKNKFENRFEPRLRVVMNVIDRHDMEWHQENEHTKLLSSKVNTVEKDEGVLEFADIGIPISCYDLILTNVIQAMKLQNKLPDWNELDIVIKKLGETPWYEVRDATEAKIGAEAQALASTASLTEEEMNWERYDLDKIYKPASYHKLQRNFKGLFQSWDGYRGTNYTGELEQLVEEEKELHKEMYGNDSDPETEGQPKGTHTSVPSDPKPSRRVKKDEPAPEEKDSEPEDTRTPIEKMKAAGDIFPHLDKLTEEDWKEIEKKLKDFKDGVPVWDRTVASEIVPCDTSGCKYPNSSVATEWPDTVLHCACCGTEYVVD